ncbi:vesicle transport protein sec20-like [Plakobranchus ocellatus]|uniref:Vesicle transport protein sec20-like n=1 Tax=Plakobranchus ocellatus TaxID=259542 RepID=A0AAV4DA77_9GAST|nr:vesicle transport protein sec20-like [Plakobranchus ocellatus]
MAEDIHVRLCLQEIVKLDLEAKALIQDIKNDVQTVEMLDDFSANGRQKISSLRGKIAELERLGLEQSCTPNKDAIAGNVESMRQNLSSTVKSLREACIHKKLELDRKAKDELLHGQWNMRRRNQVNKETLAKSANDISESLVSLNRTMAEQVKQSESNITTLDHSSTALRKTQAEFNNMGSHIQNSQRLLTKYGRRELTDRLLILLALVFFFATVLYIIKKRLWPA